MAGFQGDESCRCTEFFWACSASVQPMSALWDRRSRRWRSTVANRPRSERLSGRHRPGRPRRRWHGPCSPDHPRRQRKTGPRDLGDHPRRVAQSDKVWLPRSAKWIKAFIDELVRFTGRDDRADDQVDMTAYAAWQVRQVFNDAAVPLIEVRPNEGSRAAELGMWGRAS